MNSRTLKYLAVAAALMLPCAGNADPIMLRLDDDKYLVGLMINLGAEMTVEQETTQVINLIGFAKGHQRTIDSVILQRSDNFSDPLPAVGTATRIPGTGSFLTSAYGYVLANYSDFYYMLWYIGLTDTTAMFGPGSPTSMTLFESTETGPTNNNRGRQDTGFELENQNSRRPSFQTAVPDGGVTVTLLGCALGALALMRRRHG